MTKRFSTPDISDKYSHSLAINIQFRSFGKKEYFCGQVKTAQCPEDNSKLKEILSQDGSGQVLLVDGNGSYKVALLGDMIAKQAIENSWEGVIINGCVRDVEILKTLSLGIFAIGSCPVRSNKENRGTLGQPIEIGGISVKEGSWIFADESGVLVSKVASFHVFLKTSTCKKFFKVYDLRKIRFFMKSKNCGNFSFEQKISGTNICENHTFFYNTMIFIPF